MALDIRHVLQIAVEAAQRAARDEPYARDLVDDLYTTFSIGGVGHTVTPTGADLTHGPVLTIAGFEPYSAEAFMNAKAVAPRHPAILHVASGATKPFKLSSLVRFHDFWQTDVYWHMHGVVEGPYTYPATVPLLLTKQTAVFLGIHKQSRDYDDQEMEALTLLQRPVSRALAYREALNRAVMELQHAGDTASASQPTRRTRGGDLRVAVDICQDFQPTRRQAEVLALAAAGWTNRQIGTRLGITERTVRKHLTDVYDQAGLRGRAAATAWWQRRQGS